MIRAASTRNIVLDGTLACTSAPNAARSATGSTFGIRRVTLHLVHVSVQLIYTRNVSTNSPDDGQAERERLLHRIHTLESALEYERERFDLFAATLPGISWEVWGFPFTGLVNYVSASALDICGYPPEDWQRRPGFYLELVHADDRHDLVARVERAFATDEQSGTLDHRLVHATGKVLHVQVRYLILRGEDGRPFAWQAFTLDVTPLRAAEAARDDMQDALIRQQAALLEQLSTPLLPIHDQIVVLPLIGRVDKSRVEQATEVLLPRLVESRARFAIIDITGVPSLDTGVAAALLSCARATRMLGVELLITGIRPAVALAFCQLGDQLRGVVTLTSLREGVAHALRAR